MSPILLMMACVVRYGEGVEPPVDPVVEPTGIATQVAQRPDFLASENALAQLAQADSQGGADRMDRLLAAQELAQQMSDPTVGADPAVDRYLRKLIAIEQRALPEDAPILVDNSLRLAGGVVEEELGVDPPTEDTGETAEPADTQEPDAPEVPDDPEQVSELVRTALAAGEYKDALQLLTPYKTSPAWPQLESLWTEAVDGWVHLERERAGQLFINSRSLPTAERLIAVEGVVELLEGLLRDYPETSFRGAINGNLKLVRQELTSLKSQ